MELFLGFVIAVYILFSFLIYMIYEELLGVIFETLNKHIKTASIILGLLWPITLLILPVVAIIVLYNDLKK